MDRKKFFLSGAAGLSGLILAQAPITALAAAAGGRVQANGRHVPAGGQQVVEPYKVELVKEFVIAGHKDLGKCQSMVKDYPNLVFSKFDWGNGDFEAGIEGAGHMGEKAIAQFLLDAGSRVTLFVLATLGRGDLVKPVLEAYPSLVFAHGPHGFTMLHHAKVAGKEGEDLYAYLQKKGLTDDWVKIK
jgi:hypothetical protein